MIFSMTGYGRGVAGNEKVNFETEIKSVNSRYLDVFFRLPSSLQSKEYELREQIKSKIKRGKITLLFQIKSNESALDVPPVSKEKLKAFLTFIKDIKKAAKINEKTKIEHLLAFKELFIPDQFEFKEEEFALVKVSLDKALNELLKMKRKEGGELSKDLIKRINSIDEKIVTIEDEFHKSVNEHFDSLKEKVKTLIENTSEYSDRLELELALIAEKADVTEECVRLKSHLKFFLESIDNEEEPGRKLNFISEEEFLKKIEENGFVEWEKFYDYYYGTPKGFIEEKTKSGISVLLEIDVKGALNIKLIYPDAILIYISPPSFEVLVERLKNRKTEDENDLKKRIERAKMELSLKEKFDYLVVNKDLNTAVSEVKTIIKRIISKEK